MRVELSASGIGGYVMLRVHTAGGRPYHGDV